MRSLVVEMRKNFNGARFRNQNDGPKQLDERSESVRASFE